MALVGNSGTAVTFSSLALTLDLSPLPTSPFGKIKLYVVSASPSNSHMPSNSSSLSDLKLPLLQPGFQFECRLSLSAVQVLDDGTQPKENSFIYVDNFIHADMHPGNNILVWVGQSKSSRKRLFKSKPHVIFLDVGMTAELSNSDRVNLLEFFKAVARRDGRTAAESTLKLSKQHNCPNPEAFIKERRN